MLDESARTPRPRPPRTGSNISPGPPLSSDIPDFPSLNQNVDHDISDPIRATAMMLGIKLDDPELSPTTITDISEKSREELANLFLQAEKVIRAREAELTLAANLGKTLLETNEALKLRHDALLSRLPVMQPSLSRTPIKSRSVSDQWTTDEEVPAASILPPGSRRGSPTHSPSDSNASLFTPAHRRRISASPSALLALSETNTELIDELTRLRTATDTAQVEGASRLRKLQREISGLKAELDIVQRTNTELEERMQSQRDAEQRQLWEQRLQNLRLKGSSDEDYPPPTQDFAPPGQGIEAYDSIDSPCRSHLPPPPIDTTIRPSNLHTLDSPHNRSASPTTSSKYSTISQGEYAVVTQLYHKVEELQRANKELASRSRITQRQLAQAERNALEIKRVYDTIREELGADADAEQSEVDDGRRTPTPTGGRLTPRTMRGPRVDRSVTPRPNSWAFRAKKSAPFSDNTLTKSKRGLGNKHMLNGARASNSKVRKPLTDTLFIAPPGSTIDIQRSSSPTPPYNRPSSSSTRAPSPFGSISDSHRSRANSFTGETRHRSLGSELGGGAFGLGDADRSVKLPNMNNNDSEGKASGCTSNSNTNTDNDEEDHPALVALRRILDDDDFFLSFDPLPPASYDSENENKPLSRRESALKRMAEVFNSEYSVVVADPTSFDQKSSSSAGPGRDEEAAAKHSLFVLALLELWIYIQFAVVICFFVYTMARRGPRNVMGLPPRRG